jgi:serine/threonine-protein kinase
VKTCPTCSREFPDNVKFCPNDGGTLRAKAASADLVGQVVADKFHILKKLGEGGMGAVYLGEHVKMGRKSAIKVMASAMAHDPDAVARFNREASNASKISHPNVCQIFDFGETSDGLIYLAMEFIEGKALKDLIEEEGALPAPRAAHILRQSADALQAAHDLGIVHRDIKPDNIMVIQGKDGSDIVKVVDFGIARAVGGDEPGQKVTKTGLVVGTPEYMSPEQLSGDKLDGRSDIYSLGLVLYRMLTGTLPFQADSAQETMIKRLTDDPMPLSAARSDIDFPPKLQLVLNSALARSAAERYQNAADFGRDTMDAVAGMKTPDTRVQVAHEGATHIMSKDDLTNATKSQVASPKPKTSAAGPRPTGPTATPAAAKKSSTGLIVGGGVGAVAIIATVAVLMSRSGTNAGAADSTAGRQQVAQNPNGGTTLPTDSPTSGASTTAKRPGTNQTVNQTHVTPNNPPPNNPPPNNGVTAGMIEDSVNAAVREDQSGHTNVSRRLARWVFYRDEATSKQKSDAAELIATTYDTDAVQACQWLANGVRYAVGGDKARIQKAITDLGCTP